MGKTKKMDDRTSHAVERYFEQIKEHLRHCTECREHVLECMSDTKE